MADVLDGLGEATGGSTVASLKVLFGAEMTPFLEAISSAESALQALDLKPPPVVVRLDLAAFMAGVAEARAALRALADSARGVSFRGGLPAGIAEARAEGGPVQAGRLYLVGERGAELFTPTQSGAIIPNAALKSSAAHQAISIGAVHLHGVQDPAALLAALEDVARRQNRRLGW